MGGNKGVCGVTLLMVWIGMSLGGINVSYGGDNGQKGGSPATRTTSGGDMTNNNTTTNVKGGYAESEDVCTVAPPPGSYRAPPPGVVGPGGSEEDGNLLLFALNLEYLEAELFLNAGFGSGLDRFAPELAAHGPPPIGAQPARLDPLTQDLVQQLALQEVGHIRAIKETIVSAFPRVQVDISKQVFSIILERALGRRLTPPFDPYANSINFLIAMYIIPYVGLTGYVGANSMLTTPTAKRLVGGLLAVEAGQDALIRTVLYTMHKHEVVYGLTVAEITGRLSTARNTIDNSPGVVDEGIVVPKCLGAEGRINGNALAGDPFSLGYARTPAQILSILYTTGNPSRPGGFFPRGASGFIAQQFLHSH